MDDRLFLLLGLLSGAVGLGYVVRRVRAGRAVTFSLHAAERTDTYMMFALCLTVSVICYYIFGMEYLIPTTHVSPLFIPLYILLLSCIFVSGWIPDVVGWKRQIHYGVGYVMILLVPILTLLIALAEVSAVTQIIASLSTLVALIILYLFFFVKSSHNFILLYQGVYLAALNAPLFSAAYL